MNTMNTPGFTAGNSLYDRGRKYSMPNVAIEKSGSVIEPQLINRHGGSLLDGPCENAYQNCYINCSFKSPIYQEGCYDSCDAAYHLCKTFPFSMISFGRYLV